MGAATTMIYAHKDDRIKAGIEDNIQNPKYELKKIDKIGKPEPIHVEYDPNSISNYELPWFSFNKKITNMYNNYLKNMPYGIRR